MEYVLSKNNKVDADGLLVVVGSGSSGNSYILDANGKQLIIEIGCPYESIVRSLDYDISRVCGAIVSHRHGDHLNLNTLSKFNERGISVYGNSDVVDASNGIVLQLGKKTKIGGDGGFTIQALDVPHNVPCSAFVIDNDSLGRCVFATDLSFFQYYVKHVKHLFIEANYAYDYVIENSLNNEMGSHPENHLEISDTIEVAKRIKKLSDYGDSIMTCVLLHMSESNGNGADFVKRVKEEAKLRSVYLAEKNLRIPLYRDEY